MTNDKLAAARDSFSGKSMTEGQLKEAIAIADILHGEIHRTGSFIEKLTDYAHAFARNEKFDAMRGEKFIRDVYTAIQGRSMNQTREALMAAEKDLPDTARAIAFAHADSIPGLIQTGETMPFYQAYDRMAVRLAGELGITQSTAKTLMKEAYGAVDDRDLYAHGKEIEERYHKPVRDAEIAARQADHQRSHSRSQSMG